MRRTLCILALCATSALAINGSIKDRLAQATIKDGGGRRTEELTRATEGRGVVEERKCEECKRAPNCTVGPYNCTVD